MVDCYQSFVASVALPQHSYRDISIDGDNLKFSRYRLRTINESTLKIISDPAREIYRKEYGKSRAELTEKFSGKQAIFGWREDESSGVTLFTMNFEENILSVISIPSRTFLCLRRYVFFNVAVLEPNESGGAPQNGRDFLRW